MFAIVSSALFSIVGWLFRSIIIKFVLYFALFFVATEFIAFIIPKLPGASSLTSAFSSQAPGVWYFLDLFKVGYGISAMLAAYVTRFAIRRIPVIG